MLRHILSALVFLAIALAMIRYAKPTLWAKLTGLFKKKKVETKMEAKRAPPYNENDPNQSMP